ncbi:MAG: ABC transporter ATP-binding protein [Eubacteriales bacterium]
MKRNNVASVVAGVVKDKLLLSVGVVASVIAAVAVSLAPPLVLEAVINRIVNGSGVPISLAVAYFAVIAASCLLESARESLLTVFGQKITHAMRGSLAKKLTALTAAELTAAEPGAVVSRFIGDVDTVEALFASGVISMFADACRIVSIFAIILTKSTGLALLLLVVIPLIYLFTRVVQKRMLRSQLANRAAVARVSGHVPETIRCIRTVHMLGKEEYMKKKYGEYIDRSYSAVEKTNFYDAIYSPVITVFNAVTVAAVMILSASGNTTVLHMFGMSVGTAVAIINYISQIFTPIESLGMEIQTVQSAIAGVRRINDFLNLPERPNTVAAAERVPGSKCIEIRNVTFGYGDEKNVLDDFSLSVDDGEQVTLAGRTGAGKSTVFKLLLGLYRPRSGEVLIGGVDAAAIPDTQKRRIFGCVEQSFHMVPGSVKDQITLFDPSVSFDDVKSAARLVGLDETIEALPEGYDTACTPSIFSQGQWQLLAIARAVAADPKILLLDEITANLDADTEQTVLEALRQASADRTVVSISHRLFEHTGSRLVTIGG